MAKTASKTGVSTPRPIDPRFAKLLSALAKAPGFAVVLKDYHASRAKGGQKFGADALKVRGKIFAMISSRNHLVVKLAKERVDALVAARVGEHFDPGHGRVMKQWLAVTSPKADWPELVREAHAYGKQAK